MKKMSYLIGLLFVLTNISLASEPLVITNDSLGKYDKPEYEQQWSPSTDPASGRAGSNNTGAARAGTRRGAASQSPQYYCSQMTRLQRNIETARTNLANANRPSVPRRVLTERGIYETTYYKDEAKIKRAQERLEQAQAELETFQETARKNGVPPGWLRCDK